MGTHKYTIQIDANISQMEAKIAELKKSLEKSMDVAPTIENKKAISEVKAMVDKMQKELNSLHLKKITVDKINLKPMEDLKKLIKEISIEVDKINKKNINIDVTTASKSLNDLESKLKSIGTLYAQFKNRPNIAAPVNIQSGELKKTIDEMKAIETQIKNIEIGINSLSNTSIVGKDLIKGAREGNKSLTEYKNGVKKQFEELEEIFIATADITNKDDYFKKLTDYQNAGARAFGELAKLRSSVFTESGDRSFKSDTFYKKMDDEISYVKEGLKGIEILYQDAYEKISESDDIKNYNASTKSVTNQSLNKITVPVAVEIKGADLDDQIKSIVNKAQATANKDKNTIKIKVKANPINVVTNFKSITAEVREEVKSTLNELDNLKFALPTIEIPKGFLSGFEGLMKQAAMMKQASDIIKEAATSLKKAGNLSTKLAPVTTVNEEGLPDEDELLEARTEAELLINTIDKLARSVQQMTSADMSEMFSNALSEELNDIILYLERLETMDSPVEGLTSTFNGLLDVLGRVETVLSSIQATLSSPAMASWDKLGNTFSAVSNDRGTISKNDPDALAKVLQQYEDYRMAGGTNELKDLEGISNVSLKNLGNFNLEAYNENMAANIMRTTKEIDTQSKVVLSASNAMQEYVETLRIADKERAKSATQIKLDDKAREKALNAQVRAYSKQVASLEKQIAKQTASIQKAEQKALANIAKGESGEIAKAQRQIEKKLASIQKAETKALEKIAKAQQKASEQEAKRVAKRAEDAELDNIAKKIALIEEEEKKLKTLNDAKKSAESVVGDKLYEAYSADGKTEGYYEEIYRLQSALDSIIADEAIQDITQLRVELSALDKEIKALETNKGFNVTNTGGAAGVKGTLLDRNDITSQESMRNAMYDYASSFGAVDASTEKFDSLTNKITLSVTEADGAIRKITGSYDALNQSMRVFSNVDYKNTTVSSAEAGKIQEAKMGLMSLQAEMEKFVVKNKMTADGLEKIEGLIQKVGKTSKDSDLSSSDMNKTLKSAETTYKQLSKTEERYNDLIESGKTSNLGASGSIDDNIDSFMSYADSLGKVQKDTLRVNELTDQMSVKLRTLNGQELKINAFKDANNDIRTFNERIGTTTTAMSRLGATVQKMGANFAMYFGVQEAMQWFMQQGREGLDFVLQLDSQLTTINSTMPTTQSELKALGDQAIETAKSMGTTVDSVTEVAEIYANTQETVESIVAKTAPTIKLANASGLSASESADVIQGIVQQYSQLEGQEHKVVDSIEKVSASLKMNFGDGIQNMSAALQKSGSIANEAGLSYEKLIAISGKISEVTRNSGETTGNSLDVRGLTI